MTTVTLMSKKLIFFVVSLTLTASINVNGDIQKNYFLMLWINYWLIVMGDIVVYYSK